MSDSLEMIDVGWEISSCPPDLKKIEIDKTNQKVKLIFNDDSDQTATSTYKIIESNPYKMLHSAPEYIQASTMICERINEESDDYKIDVEKIELSVYIYEIGAYWYISKQYSPPAPKPCNSMYTITQLIKENPEQDAEPPSETAAETTIETEQVIAKIAIDAWVTKGGAHTSGS